MAVGCKTVRKSQERRKFGMDFSELRGRGFGTTEKGGSDSRADSQTKWIEEHDGLVRYDRLRVAGKKCRLMLATGVPKQNSLDKNNIYAATVFPVRNQAE